MLESPKCGYYLAVDGADVEPRVQRVFLVVELELHVHKQYQLTE